MSLLVFTVGYATASAVFLFPTPASARSGLTYQQVFSRRIPAEKASVVAHHLARTSVFHAVVRGLILMFIALARVYYPDRLEESIAAVTWPVGYVWGGSQEMNGPRGSQGGAWYADYVNPHDPLLLSLASLVSLSLARHYLRIGDPGRRRGPLRFLLGPHPLTVSLGCYGPFQRVAARIDAEVREGMAAAARAMRGGGAGGGDVRVDIDGAGGDPSAATLDVFELQGCKTIVTRSWIVAVRTASADVAHLHDVTMRVDPTLTSEIRNVGGSSSNGFNNNGNLDNNNNNINANANNNNGYGSSGVTRVLGVRCVPSRPGIREFNIHVLESDWSRLAARLQAVVVNAQEVVLGQTLDQIFVAAFRGAVERNTAAHAEAVRNGTAPQHEAPAADPDELCIGCLRNPPEVRLVTRCASGHDEMQDLIDDAPLDANFLAGQRDRPAQGRGARHFPGSRRPPPCRPCFCRPFWCAECLARWFQARQMESLVPQHGWMLGGAECPTCRAGFCALDVVSLDGDGNSSSNDNNDNNNSASGDNDTREHAE